MHVHFTHETNFKPTLHSIAVTKHSLERFLDIPPTHFMLLQLWLACAAALSGTAHMMPLLPTLSPDLGSTWTALAGFAGLVPIVLTADACHTNLHPILSMLKPYSTQRMQRVVSSAMVFVNIIYVIVVFCACAAFGPQVRNTHLAQLLAQQRLLFDMYSCDESFDIWLLHAASNAICPEVW